MTINSHKFTVNGTEHDLFAMPDASVSAMIGRGITHYFGSEVASKVKAWQDKIEAGDTESTPPVAPRPVSDDEKAAKKAELVGDFLSRLSAGEVGVRTPAIQVDPVEKVLDRLVRESVLATLAANGIKAPKKDESIQFADGSTRTMADMLARRKAMGKDPATGAEFAAEAARIVKAQQKKKAAAEAAVPEVKSADALGL